MNWKSITKHEIRRLKKGKGIMLFVILSFLFYFYNLPASITGQNINVLGANAALLHLQVTFSVLVPVACLLFSYRSIIKGQENGQLKIVAALPHTRKEIIFGKFLGIGAVLSAGALIVIVVIAVFSLLFYGFIDPLLLLLFTAATFVFVYVFTAIGLLISTILSTTMRATAVLLISIFLALSWRSLFTSHYMNLRGYQMSLWEPLPKDGFLYSVRRIDPQSSYFVVTNWIADTGNAAGHFSSSLAKLHASPDERVFNSVYPVELTYQDSVPLYLTEPVSLLLLLLWLVVPLSIAVWRFEKGDIV